MLTVHMPSPPPLHQRPLMQPDGASLAGSHHTTSSIPCAHAPQAHPCDVQRTLAASTACKVQGTPRYLAHGHSQCPLQRTPFLAGLLLPAMYAAYREAAAVCSRVALTCGNGGASDTGVPCALPVTRRVTSPFKMSTFFARVAAACMHA